VTRQRTAAATLWGHWLQGTRIDGLPAECRPFDRAEGYAVQDEIVQLSGQKVVGWKIAATSVAGQTHIGVDGPLASALLANRVFGNAATIPLDGNIMNVAEAEFAFRLKTPLPPRPEAYTMQDVLSAVDTLHPAIEVPDSRYNKFAGVGAPQLIADSACACWFMLGPRTHADWRSRDLTTHPVVTYLNDTHAASGSGANVLGDPRIALLWIANELRTFGRGLAAGQFVTTGTCIVPVAIRSGDRVRADFGDFGSVEVKLS
jgi:2-keto-4-pentenoate hydratase